ncbi:alpha/beta fold hydrolase, partial [Streptomyces venezuelae]|uniref:alpha/beta fold hydrolase n=1 Tax=Streptomyces venezuelae TaxID=54571 RepID=UPI001F3CA7A3
MTFEGFRRIGGVAHHVLVDGSGPVCVLSAGLGLSWFDWDPVVPLLARHRTVVRFDRPGHGLSQPAAGPPTAAGEAHRIAAVLDALEVPGPATVVGHSIAGFHAEAFARLHPDRTAALLLVDPSVTVFRWLFDEQFGVVNWLMRTLGFEGYEQHNWFETGFSTLV